MFKKLPLFLVFALFAITTYGQTIVSTSPENKNVILEEFTGIKCVYCPDGHRIAQGLKSDHPDDVFLINIHAGGFAVPSSGQPDFRTPDGEAIRAHFGVNSYPSGMINRHTFSGNSPVIGRSAWPSRANIILGESSYLNVAVEASIDVQTRELIVHVEGYYTGNSPESTNFLTVTLLQNNTKGPQTGGGAGNNYNHMHRLVDIITPTWGDPINTTTATTFVDRTYTYTIPAMYNNVPAVVDDMEVAAFITETQSEIVSGHGARATFTGITIANDVSVHAIKDIDPTCESNVAPVVTIKNLGQNTVTSLAITYEVNGDSHTYNWTGNLPALWDETITLPEVPFTMQATNTVDVTIPSDDDNSNNTLSSSFDKAPEGTGSIDVRIITDAYGYECRWNLKDSNGDIIESGGPYPNNTTTEFRINVAADCYTFTLIDTAGNGGTRATLKDHEGTILYNAVGNWGAEKPGQFLSNGVLGVNQSQLDNLSLYPNPASTVLNLKNAENANIQVFDVLGKLILSQDNIAMDAQINVANLANGTYFIKISKDNAVATKRFLISK
ncbi:T9SS type A sorting domain-containing protein [Aequorivita viscosa]|nr:T9SS type A sorting domain-containing protein [Aequorivita viscosa]